MPDRLSYSKEIHEIMGRIPVWIVRWGTWLLLFLLLILLIISCLIKYPETITAPISISESIREDVPPTGIMNVSGKGYGKIKEGQQVRVKLKGYPISEYGILKGTISEMSPDLERGGYKVQIRFSDSLITSYGIVLPEDVRHEGIGDIVISETSLLKRFFYPVILLYEKGE